MLRGYMGQKPCHRGESPSSPLDSSCSNSHGFSPASPCLADSSTGSLLSSVESYGIGLLQAVLPSPASTKFLPVSGVQPHMMLDVVDGQPSSSLPMMLLGLSLRFWGIARLFFAMKRAHTRCRLTWRPQTKAHGTGIDGSADVPAHLWPPG